MKTPLNWLAEYVDTKGLTPEQISDGLRLSGTENVLVSGQNLPNIVVGEIKEIVKHPNADKLQITKTDVGKKNGGILQVVCGAPNIKVGQKVPVALVGARFEDFEIKKAKIRDIESCGMLCSEVELSLGEDHSGIMILDKDAKVGKPLSEHLGGGEAVIDAELTPNRGDCLSMVGMAREVAATFDRKFKMPVVKKQEVKTFQKIEVEVIDKNLCPRYIAKVIEGVNIGPSPKWMQERLTAAGVRPISNVVDVTNYVMLELGQPMHAFDYSKISNAQVSNAKSQGTKKIIVRKAETGEVLTTLDGQERKLTAEDLLICDAKKPIALAGVMGGLNSEVDEKTTAIVLEAAVFNPASTRKTAQKLSLRSEASNRFEKGISLNLPEMAIERAAELLVATAEKPDTLAVGQNTDILSSWIWVSRIGLRLSRIKRYLGVDIKEAEAIKILDSLGFTVEKFDFKAEARKHVGKPYVFGASYKTHGDMAFDCSYLTDYIYSKIGKFIGYTSLAQFELGRPVKGDELKAGDVLFIKGHIDKSATEHYFIPDRGGLAQRSLGGVGYEKVTLEKPKEVGHNALYIGNGRIVHASHYDYDFRTKKWSKNNGDKGKVIEEDVSKFLEHPEYLGARRFIDDPSDYLALTAPWWRLDVKVEEDILEELVRIVGYDKIPSILPAGALLGAAQNKRVVMEGQLKQKLVHQGATEVITYSFVSEKLAKLSGFALSKMPRINNPLSVDQEYMRGALWPSLVEVATKNQDYAQSLRIFEIASVYREGSCREEAHFGAAVKIQSGKVSFYELKGMLQSLLKEFNDVALEFKPANISFARPGQGAEIIIKNKKVGEVGVLDKKIANQLGHKADLAIAEINLSQMLDMYGRKIVYKTLPKFPHSKRDVSLIFENTVLVNDINRALAGVNDANLLSFRVSDVFEGAGLETGKKSVMISLEIGSEKKTLTDIEIESTLDLATKALIKVGGQLRF